MKLRSAAIPPSSFRAARCRGNMPSTVFPGRQCHPYLVILSPSTFRVILSRRRRIWAGGRPQGEFNRRGRGGWQRKAELNARPSPTLAPHPDPSPSAQDDKGGGVILRRRSRRRIWVGGRGYASHATRLKTATTADGYSTLSPSLEDSSGASNCGDRGSAERRGGQRHKGAETICQPAGRAGFCAWFRSFARFPGKTRDFGHFLG